MLHTLSIQIDAETIHSDRRYWKQHGISVVKPVETVRDKRDIAIFDPITHDSRTPDYNVSQSKFWSIVSKNPNKGVRDYHEKFDHNMPLPIVSKDEIVYTFEGPQIYFNLINQIIRMEKYIHYDNPDFLKLVADHIQIFERHWRKMVADIRHGKLDRNLPISAESRTIFESANLPKPSLSSKLDQTFRQLGFHKKVLGKDIQIQAFAEKKQHLLASSSTTINTSPDHHSSSIAVVPTLYNHNIQSQRKHSLPTTAMRTTSSQLLHPIMTPNKEQSSSSPIKQQQSSSSFPSKSESKRLMLETIGHTSTLHPNNSNALDSSSSGRTPSPSKLSKRQLLANLGNTFKTSGSSSSSTDDRLSLSTAARGGASRSSPNRGVGTASSSLSRPSSRVALITKPSSSSSSPKRRGSHSDSQRSVVSAEVDAIHYDVSTEPRDKYSHAIKIDKDRFVCPFPACGKSFHSLDAAFFHLPSHEQKARLYAPTPLADAHLNYYWPKESPWLSNDKYTDRVIPPGSIPCPVQGCHLVCENQSQLYNHLRNIHRIVDSSSVDLPYFEMLGQAMNIPPYRPPHYLPLHFCPIHTLPYGSCSICVAIDAKKEGPKPPYRLYPLVSINFKLKQLLITKGHHSLVHIPMNMKKGIKSELVMINTSESQVGVVILLDNSNVNKTHNDNVMNNSDSINRGKHSISSSSSAAAAAAAVMELKGRPVAMITDRYDIGWIAVEILFTYRDAIDRGIILPQTFNKRYQLYRPLSKYVQVNIETREINYQELEIFDEKGELAMRKYVKWIRFSQIERTFTLKMTNEIEMNSIIQNSVKSVLKKMMFLVNNADDI